MSALSESEWLRSMNGIHLNGKAHSSQKPIPGCVGRMVNLFDFASNTAGNRLITEKPHHDGSPISRSRSGVSRSSSPMDDEIEDKVMASELRKSSSGKNAKGISVKMLIDKEISKDLESRNQPHNVVAKLMGLDALPRLDALDLAPQVIYTTHYSQSSHPDSLASFFMHENNLVERDMGCEVHRFHEQKKCSDAYQIWLHSLRNNSLQYTSPQNAMHKENSDEKKMNLVRQKFLELKHLAMDENRHESKEFHDALEVLNSHKDEFVMLLQEQDSMFSQHLYTGLSVPLPEETKRITVLRPSKLVFDEKFSALGKNNEKRIKQEAKAGLANGWDKHHNGLPPSIPALRSNCSSTQPTRIVVLKPSTRSVHDFRTVISSAPPSPRSPHHTAAALLTPSSPRYSQDRFFLKQTEADDERVAREVAKEITQQMRANLASLQRDETLISSVFSGGYNGDESSFNKAETEFATGYVSDSEALSPASRQSWDYVDKENSPYSSSFNRASCSPKSSVCREAKKRLSERWAMTSGGSRQEIQLVQTESGTLGEMLALSDIKRPEILEHAECNRIQGPRGSTSCVNSNLGRGETIVESPRSLLRSKSLPLQSTDYSGGLRIDGTDPKLCRTGDLNDSDKTKTTKLSFAAKVTSFFSPRSKKSSKEKKSGKPHSKDESALPERGGNDKKNINSEGGSMSSMATASCSGSPFDRNQRPHETSEQAVLHVSKPATYGLPGENQFQPSPISVLDLPFEEDDNSILGCSRSIMSNQGRQLGPSNLIGKSSPIGSIARTLSWDDHSREAASCYSSKSPFPSPGVEEDEDKWLFLVQSLLSAAGLDSASKAGSTLAGWHSLESPLDPSLREKYVDLTIKEPSHEAKRRQLRSNSKLVFDFVNAVLLDSTGTGTSTIWSHSCASSDDVTSSNSIHESTLVDSVWSLMKEWVCGNVRFFEGDEGDGGGETGVVDRVVMKEVVGKGWAADLRSEVDKIGKVIEGKLLEELMVESVTELTNTRL
ncbi:hypothetical protein AKJ16_DCAP01597 [Drosera capensis]